MVNSLAAIGALVCTEEHIEVILDGLSDDYDPFVTSILSRTDPYTVKEIEVLFLTQKELFNKHRMVNHLPI